MQRFYDFDDPLAIIYTDILEHRLPLGGMSVSFGTCFDEKAANDVLDNLIHLYYEIEQGYTDYNTIIENTLKAIPVAYEKSNMQIVLADLLPLVKLMLSNTKIMPKSFYDIFYRKKAIAEYVEKQTNIEKALKKAETDEDEKLIEKYQKSLADVVDYISRSRFVLEKLEDQYEADLARLDEELGQAEAMLLLLTEAYQRNLKKRKQAAFKWSLSDTQRSK